YANTRATHSFPTRRSSDLDQFKVIVRRGGKVVEEYDKVTTKKGRQNVITVVNTQSKVIQLEEITPGGPMVERPVKGIFPLAVVRSEEHTSELQSRFDLVCR